MAATGMLLLSGLAARTSIFKRRQELWTVPVKTSVAVDSSSPGTYPRALILCGGGGKGAYQLGALRALAEANVTFDVMVGSSVGALNAALLLSTGIDNARHLFANELGRMFKPTLRGLLVALIRILSLEGRYLTIKRNRLRKATGFLLAAVSTILLLPENHASYWEFWFTIYMSVNFVPIYLSWAAWLACEHWNWAALSEGRLAGLIKDNIDEKLIAKHRTRLLVTVARETEVSPLPEFGTGGPGPVYVPEYIEAADASGELHRWLLASASVPFGILPHVRNEEAVYVDGGLVDNAPILPALEAGCREIVMIHTNAEAIANGQRLTDHDGLIAHLSRCRLLRDVGLMTLAEAEEVSALNTDENTVKHQFQARIIHIRPSEPTGSLIRSLLFSGKPLAQRLDNLGYRDAVAILESSRLQSSAY